MTISETNHNCTVKCDKDGELDMFELKMEKEDLHNKTRGAFGFILHGTKTMGVYVKEIRGGSLIEKEGRLHMGDQLMQVGDMSLVGMTAEQVVHVLKTTIQMHAKTMICVIHQARKGIKAVDWRAINPNIVTTMNDRHLADEVSSCSGSLADSMSTTLPTLETIRSSSKLDTFSPKFHYKKNVFDEVDDLNLETDEVDLGDYKHAVDVVSLLAAQFYPTKRLEIIDRIEKQKLLV